MGLVAPKPSLPKLAHFEGRECRRFSLVTGCPARALESLLQGVRSQQTKSDGRIAGSAGGLKTSSRTETHIIKVGSLTANDASERDDAVVSPLASEPGGVGQFPRPRNGDNIDITRLNSVTLKCLQGSRLKLLRYDLVKPTHNQAKPPARAGIRRQSHEERSM